MKKIIYRTRITEYSNKDLARIFDCSTKTINRRIAVLRPKLGVRVGHKWNIIQVEMIFAHLDYPYEVIEVDEETKDTTPQCVIKFHINEIESARNAG